MFCNFFSCWFFIFQHIFNKIANPINPGNKKILIFTAFADTADYLYAFLSPILESKGIHCAKVTGSKGATTTLKKGCDFQTILTGFPTGYRLI